MDSSVVFSLDTPRTDRPAVKADLSRQGRLLAPSIAAVVVES